MYVLTRIALLYDTTILRNCQIFNNLTICGINLIIDRRQRIDSILKHNLLISNKQWSRIYWINEIGNSYYDSEEYTKRICEFEITFYIRDKN